MHPFFRKLEWFVDKAMPYLLVIIGIQLILDNPLWVLYSLEHLEPWVAIIDAVIVGFFLVDLTFKWIHTRNLLKFVKLYWIDIIAVLPIYLAFRVYARYIAIIQVGEEIAEAQKIAHEAVLVRETKLVREANILAKEQRLLRAANPITRLIRTASRGFRVAAARIEVSRHALRHGILKGE